MGIIADRLAVIKPSATVALNARAMEMKAAGEDGPKWRLRPTPSVPGGRRGEV